MRWIIAMLLFLAALCSATAALSASPQHQHAPDPAPAHTHDHQTPVAPPAEPGERWPADAPLQQAMQQIRTARAMQGESAADDLALATSIDEAIAYMIRNCRLPADADAALHGVIGELSLAATALRSEDERGGAITTLDAALERYAAMFDESKRP